MDLLQEFRKIWATVGGKITVSDSDRTKGWGYLGQKPPEAEEFNFMDNLRDQKMLFLFESTFHWEPNKSYKAGDIATSKKLGYLRYLKCVGTGTSSLTESNWQEAALGDAIIDSNVTWQVRSIGYDISQEISKALTHWENANALHELRTTINHTLNAHPDLLAIEFDYGCGIGACGEVPCGGMDGRKLRSTVRYLNGNQIQVALEKDYGVVDSITSISSTRYIVTFINSTLSVLLVLITGGY